MIDHFPRSVAFTLREEGGNVDDPDDPGGRTSRGVTQATYDESCKAAGWSPGDVFLAAQARILAIYRQRYWNRVHGDLLAWPLVLAVFDTSVLHGPAKAREWLAAHPDLEGFLAAREASYAPIVAAKPKTQKFLAAWLGRVRRLRAVCLAAAAPLAKAA